MLILCAYTHAKLGLASNAGVPVTEKTQKVPSSAQMLSGEALVKYVNENQTLFKAKITPASHEVKYKLMDLKFKIQASGEVIDDDSGIDIEIPESFDSRKKWANCSSLFDIRDQSNCGSCWAVSSAAAMSDRICISTKGAKQVRISATDIMSCCEYCGFGCEGGWTALAWEFFDTEGVVTGGNYRATGCCRPYPIPPCGHHGNETYYGECSGIAPTPDCKKKCQPGYRRHYVLDKFYGKKYYHIRNSVKGIQRDLMENGPLVASFEVYEDFAYYESGIYKYTAGMPRGYHAVKIIGWGKENGTDYWLIANSWHNDWGENGYFRIIRGTNECGIEEDAVASLVDFDH
ncbi:hypothetical protein V3C99_005944 [Haemonchus contortus]